MMLCSDRDWLAVQTAQLRALNLSDNALGEKGVRACSAALTGQVNGLLGPICQVPSKSLKRALDELATLFRLKQALLTCWLSNAVGHFGLLHVTSKPVTVS